MWTIQTNVRKQARDDLETGESLRNGGHVCCFGHRNDITCAYTYIKLSKLYTNICTVHHDNYTIMSF